MEYKATVVIPVYNAESTVSKTVDSLVNGDEKNVEIILVDDCSTDNSWQICKQLESENTNVVAIKNNVNSGVSHTRNVGIENATSPYIVFVDSDDWVAPSYITELLSSVKQSNLLPIVCFNFICNNEISEYLYNPYDRNNSKLVSGLELFDVLNKNLLQFCWNKIFKTDVIMKNHIRFNEKQNMGEDFEFVIDYMMSTNMDKCLIINKPLYFYTRTEKQSLMTNFGWTSIDEDFNRLDKLALLLNNTEEAIRKADLEKQRMKENAVYHVVRTSYKTKKEKIHRIEDIMRDGKASKYYYAQLILAFKEKIKKRFK